MQAPLPHELRFPPDRAHRDPRCLGCGYRLRGLTDPTCPECGRGFDPGRPATYSRRPPFVWYRYWWPGVLLSLGVGLLWCVGFYYRGELGWGLFIGVPFMLGALIGYRPLPKRPGVSLLTRGAVVVTAMMLVGLLMVGGLAGLFCGVMLLAIFVPFALMGYFVGVGSAWILAAILKQTPFSQRAYLPVLLLFMMLPGVAHLLQASLAAPLGPVTVQTSRVFDMDADAAWDTRLFYEDVPGPRPFLHQIGLPRPTHVEGGITAVGDRHVSTYTKGARIVKQATAVEPGRLLAFELVEQENFEDRSVRFIQGRFGFTPVDTHRTRVTLASTYQPMLRPRILWRPIERTMARTLHGHILGGMAAQAELPALTQALNPKGGQR